MAVMLAVMVCVCVFNASFKGAETPETLPDGSICDTVTLLSYPKRAVSGGKSVLGTVRVHVP